MPLARLLATWARLSYHEPMSGFYHVMFLGSEDGRRADIQGAVTDRAHELGVDDDAISFLVDSSRTAPRNRSLPSIVIYLGATASHVSTDLIRELIAESVVIVPVVTTLSRLQVEIPPELQNVNALELGFGGSGLERLASLVLETFRLLRAERRLFISYKRDDSQAFANRLYDALDAHGFDVFIGVRSVPPAVDFQSELWHRMSDADVVVLIDTPGFRASRWRRRSWHGRTS
jgi:hypothetical protein